MPCPSKAKPLPVHGGLYERIIQRYRGLGCPDNFISDYLDNSTTTRDLNNEALPLPAGLF